MTLLPNFIICNADWQVIEQSAQPIVRDNLFCSRKKKRVNDKHLLQVETWSVCCSIKAVIVHILLEHITGSGRVYAGFGIWPKYGAGIGKTIKALTGSGIWLFPGKRDSPKIGHGIRDLCLRVCRECRKSSRPTGSSGQSESTRRALSGFFFQTKNPMKCLVNRS